MPSLKIKRGTSAQLDAAAAASALSAGEPYLITNENRLAVGLSATGYERFAKVSELGGGGPMDYAVGALSADVSMPTSNTWYSGPSVSLPAGVWLVMANLTQIRSSTTAEHIYARLWDGSAAHASTQEYHPSVSSIGVSLSLSAVVSLAATTTLTAQMATTAGNAASTIKAALTANGQGQNASTITALRIG